MATTCPLGGQPQQGATAMDRLAGGLTRCYGAISSMGDQRHCCVSRGA